MAAFSTIRGLGMLAVIAVGCSKRSEPPAPPPVPVTVSTAAERPVPLEIGAIGNVLPEATVTVRPVVGGALAKVYFKEGQEVRQGELLFQIDPRPFQADLRQAQATLAKDAAQMEKARRDEARYAELVRQGFISRQQYDQARADAASMAAAVRADRATVQNAQVQLGYTTIRTPITGRTGSLLVQQGNNVKANDTALVVINQIRPIDVAFALPERQLPEVRAYEARGSLSVEAVVAGAAEPPETGRLSFVDNAVNPQTGTIQLKATFPNQDGRLWPGQFVDVWLRLTTQENAVVVPATAVQAGQDGQYVFVVKPDRTVESRPVVVAREVGQQTVIARGIRPGDTVVTDGQLRLYPGARVDMKAAAAEKPPRGG